MSCQLSEETILIVDDVPLNLKLASAILRGEGYRVQTAGDGLEALDMLRSSPPDLILSDIQMPRMDGLEMARLIRQDSRWSDIPLFALTAFSSKVSRDEAMEAGFDAYLTKPVDIGALRMRVREYLDRR